MGAGNRRPERVSTAPSPARCVPAVLLLPRAAGELANQRLVALGQLAQGPLDRAEIVEGVQTVGRRPQLAAVCGPRSMQQGDDRLGRGREVPAAVDVLLPLDGPAGAAAPGEDVLVEEAVERGLHFGVE